MLFNMSKYVILRIYQNHVAGLKMLILTLGCKIFRGYEMAFAGLKRFFACLKCHFTAHGYIPFGVQRCHLADLRTQLADLRPNLMAAT